MGLLRETTEPRKKKLARGSLARKLAGEDDHGKAEPVREAGVRPEPMGFGRSRGRKTAHGRRRSSGRPPRRTRLTRSRGRSSQGGLGRLFTEEDDSWPGTWRARDRWDPRKESSELGGMAIVTGVCSGSGGSGCSVRRGLDPSSVGPSSGDREECSDRELHRESFTRWSLGRRNPGGGACRESPEKPGTEEDGALSREILGAPVPCLEIRGRCSGCCWGIPFGRPREGGVCPGGRWR